MRTEKLTAEEWAEIHRKVRLETAAPALLAACKAVSEYMKDDDIMEIAESLDPDWAALVKQVRAAVAKADGVQ